MALPFLRSVRFWFPVFSSRVDIMLMKFQSHVGAPWGQSPEEPVSTWVIFCLILNLSTLWWTECVSLRLFRLVCLCRIVSLRCVSGSQQGQGRGGSVGGWRVCWGSAYFGYSGLNKCCGPPDNRNPDISSIVKGFCLFGILLFVLRLINNFEITLIGSGPILCSIGQKNFFFRH